jgi:methylthioribose-1-phosphate isomerase
MVLAANNSTAPDAPTLVAELHAAKATLDASRPTAVNLMWATSRMMGLTELLAKGGLGVQVIREKLLEEAETLAQDDIALNKRIGLYGSEVVPHGANILHHCNTGTIATVQYGTAIGVRAREGRPGCWLR